MPRSWQLCRISPQGTDHSEIAPVPRRTAYTIDQLLTMMAPWPASWASDDDDLEPGADLVDAFQPFVRHLHHKGLATNTIRRHMNELWALGGALIRQRQMDDPPEPIPPLREVVDAEGGPLLHDHCGEVGQRSFDATCRALHRFLESGSCKAVRRRPRVEKPRPSSKSPRLDA